MTSDGSGGLAVLRWWRRLMEFLIGRFGVGRIRGSRSGRLETKRLGDRGERAAARMLRGLGFRVVGRNVRVPMGESDLVCISPDGGVLVVVEVKTRVAVAGGGPSAQSNVDERKQRKLATIAGYLAKSNGLGDRAVRVDVVTVVYGPDGRAVFEHFVGAVKG